MNQQRMGISWNQYFREQNQNYPNITLPFIEEDFDSPKDDKEQKQNINNKPLTKDEISSYQNNDDNKAIDDDFLMYKEKKQKDQQQEQDQNDQKLSLQPYQLKYSGIVIEKPKKKNEEGVEIKTEKQKIQPLQSHFVILIVGKPGSGKSYLMTQLLENQKLYFKKFNKIYVLSPSYLEGIKCTIGVNYMNQLDLSWIRKKIDLQIKIIQEEKFKEKKNLLFIIDDLVSQVRKEAYGTDLTSLIFNRRHYCQNPDTAEDFLCISYIFTTQKFIMFPYQVRQTITAIIFFGGSLGEYKAIKNEFIYSKSPFIDKYIFEAFKRDPYNFIYIRNDNSKIHVKFDELVV